MRRARFFLSRGWFLEAFLPALLLAALNSLKPAHIDDAIYLEYAHQIAHHPLDPYGFQMFWLQWPEPANWMLCPIVVPYFLAAGIAIFGEQVALLKLWMFWPALLMLGSLRSILAMTNTPHRAALLWLTAFSPLVLPGLSLFLDVPSTALVIAGVAVALRAALVADNLAGDAKIEAGAAPSRSNFARSLPPWLAAGALIGLAAETKYTALAGLPLLIIIGLLTGRTRHATMAVAAGAALFAGCEALIAAKYGESHFVLQATLVDPTRGTPSRSALFYALLPLLGTAASGLLPLALANLPRRTSGGGAAPLVLGAAGIAAIVATASLAAAASFVIALGVLGGATLVALLFLLARSTFGLRAARQIPTSDVATIDDVPPDDAFRADAPPAAPFSRHAALPIFLLAWLVVEIMSYVLISPFPAVRRGMGPTMALTAIAGYVTRRRDDHDPAGLAATATPREMPQRAIMPTHAIAWASAVIWGLAGLAIFYVDVLDARAQRDAIPAAIDMIARLEAKDPGVSTVSSQAAARLFSGRPASSLSPTRQPRIFFLGHWGFQYYAQRAGLITVIPDTSAIEPGDWVLTTDRVHTNSGNLGPDLMPLVHEMMFESSGVPFTAIPFYAGAAPVEPLVGPRLKVALFRADKPTVIRSARDQVTLREQVDLLKLRPDHVPPPAYHLLIAAMQFGEPDISASAARLLEHLGAPALLVATENASPSVRSWACRVAEPDHPRDPALDAKLRQLAENDPDAAVRAAAEKTLALPKWP